MADPTGIKQYRVVLEFDVDHDLVHDGYTSIWPDDWIWTNIIKRTVPSVGYVSCVSAVELQGEEQ